MPKFSVPVEFTEKTRAAMMAFVRFLETKRHSLSHNHKQQLIEFRDYVSKNQLLAEKPGYCECKHDISDAEIIFNVCRKCKRTYLNDTI